MFVFEASQPENALKLQESKYSFQTSRLKDLRQIFLNQLKYLKKYFNWFTQ